jgi:myo-inositol-1(or 4)-monophosphatase
MSNLAGSIAEMYLDRELEIARKLAIEAGAALRSYQAGQIEIRLKERGEIVTPADLQSNEVICRGLAAAFPRDTICSEENQPVAMESSNARVWIVDPLDSTSNYVQRGDEYSLSIGLAIDGEAVLGVVYNPTREELFSGYRGHGAFCNDVPVVCASSGAEERQPRLLVSYKEWKRGVNALSGTMLVQPMASMAYKLARVAAGKKDAVFSLKTRKPWGTCAGTALVLAAGGRVTSLDAEPLVFDCRGPRTFNGIVAANRNLHASTLVLALGLRSSLPEHPTE